MAKTPTPKLRLPFQRAAEPGADGEAGAAAGAAETAQPGEPGPNAEAAETGGPGPAGSAAESRPPRPVSGETVFYLVVGAVLAVYTAMAFDMEWQTTAGRVGAGLFPRIIGGLGLAVCVIGAVRSALVRMRELRRAAADQVGQAGQDEQAGPDEQDDRDEQAGTPAEPAPAPAQSQQRYPWTVAALCLILAAFVTVMVPVGAVITGTLALIAALLLCDRSHPLRSVLLGAVFPAALYTVFVLWLNAPLPPGILPIL
ncbi:hypothetical protein GCM10027570_13690 [Streptomonospora sediminis]